MLHPIYVGWFWLEGWEKRQVLRLIFDFLDIQLCLAWDLHVPSWVYRARSHPAICSLCKISCCRRYLKISCTSLQSQWKVREFYLQVAAWVLLGFFASKRQFCFKITCKASLFLLIHGHNTHPAGSAKIAFQLVKSRYFFLFWWVWTLCEVLSSFVNEPQFVIDNIWFVNVLDWNGNEIISKKDV